MNNQKVYGVMLTVVDLKNNVIRKRWAFAKPDDTIPAKGTQEEMFALVNEFMQELEKPEQAENRTKVAYAVVPFDFA